MPFTSIPNCSFLVSWELWVGGKHPELRPPAPGVCYASRLQLLPFLVLAWGLWFLSISVCPEKSQLSETAWNTLLPFLSTQGCETGILQWLWYKRELWSSWCHVALNTVALNADTLVPKTSAWDATAQSSCFSNITPIFVICWDKLSCVKLGWRPV